jgi:hypothetical protein
MGLSDPWRPPDTSITLVTRISQIQTAKYSRTNAVRNITPTR